MTEHKQLGKRLTIAINLSNLESIAEQLEITSSDDDQYFGIEIGLREGQLLPHCNGDYELCGELSEIYHLGGEFPDTGDYTLNQICARLSNNSGYGA